MESPALSEYIGYTRILARDERQPVVGRRTILECRPTPGMRL